MKRLSYFIFFLSCMLISGLYATGGLRAEPDTPSFRSGTITLQTAKAEKTLRVDFAETPPQWQHGLMYRTKLEGIDGMLFIFPAPRRISMWMKNTPLALDMVFIGADGAIVDIIPDTVPYSETVLTPKQPAKEVLELAAGRTKELGIAIGDRIRHAAP